ncbi:MAG: glycosyltransferase [Phycisphaeraceae bacterium]|nr:glycosyltransferase [Phycisphaeraceae bacterium]
MKISVLIPSSGSPEKLARCLEALASQSLARDRFEILITGQHEGASSATYRLIPSAGTSLAADRNALLGAARNDVLVFLASDVVPSADCLERHARCHESLAGKPALVVGASPPVIRLPDRLLDRVARETSLVSICSQMERHGSSLERDWTFRHASLRNFSIRTQDAAGMLFDESPKCAEYADLEWAWRVTSVRSLPVVYRTAIRAKHDHRIEPDVFLAREFSRGTHAYRIARRHPRFAKALFGRDICQADELRYSRAFVTAERGLAEQLRQEFFALADVSAESATAPAVESIFSEQLLLKRWTWRLGLVAAAAEAASETAPRTNLPLAA